MYIEKVSPADATLYSVSSITSEEVIATKRKLQVIVKNSW